MLSELADIADHPSLQRLALADVSGDNANPVCSLDGYTAHVLALAPALVVLDGRRVGTEGDLFYAEAIALEDRIREVEVR
jgi:hypothetical protein